MLLGHVRQGDCRHLHVIRCEHKISDWVVDVWFSFCPATCATVKVSNAICYADVKNSGCRPFCCLTCLQKGSTAGNILYAIAQPFQLLQAAALSDSISVELCKAGLAAGPIGRGAACGCIAAAAAPHSTAINTSMFSHLMARCQ